MNNADGDAILSETELKHMSRHIKDIVPNIGTNATNIETKITPTLDRVFQAAEAPGLSTTHRVAAWNTLCAIIDRLSGVEAAELHVSRWKRDIWNQAFDLYIEQSTHSRPKSAKQLLSTLSGALQKRSGESDNGRSEIATELLEKVWNDGDIVKTKASMQALAYFLSRDVLTLKDVITSWRALKHAESTDSESESVTIQNVLSNVLLWISKADFGSVIGQLISVILDKADSCDCGESPIWIDPVKDLIESTDLETEYLRVQIFPVLFKRNLEDYVQFLYRYGLADLLSQSEGSTMKLEVPLRDNEEILLAALQTGKDLGLMFETGDAETSRSDSCILIPVKCIGRLLSHRSRSARLASLSLLISSHSVTRPFPSKTFALLRRHLHRFFADTDANFRSEVFSQMQKLMDRLRAITAVLARRIVGGEATSHDSSIVLRLHKDFAEWLIRFLGWELRTTASYQTHISALKTLSIVTRSGIDNGVPAVFWSKSALAETKWSSNLQVLTDGLRRLLLDLLMNPFDDVRQTAATILGFYSSSYDAKHRMGVCAELSETIRRAEKLMLLTGRADQADGVAHMYNLLYQQSNNDAKNSDTNHSPRQAVLVQLMESLEHLIDIAKKDLITAVHKYPLHGLLTSLRYVLITSNGDYDFAQIPDRLVSSLHTVWQVVKPVLCNDAPEGYLPEDSYDIGHITTKDTLSYCWRALKESSLLLGIIISQPLLSEQARLSLSELCFAQLAELRHRGAFSTVAQTWVICCIQSASSHSKSDSEPLRQWYDQVIDILESNATINTRRSAGLPSLLCGLLVADKNGHLFSQAFQDLRTIAQQPVEHMNTHETSLAQVHALNCIKDMLKNTRLGEHSEPFLPASLQLAAESLRSKSWAVRNCGLMLFRAVIDRLLGTSDAYLDDEDGFLAKVISSKEYPELVETILDLVIDSKVTGQDSSSEGVFLALQLLQRTQVPESRRKEVLKVVCLLTASHSWHLRNKAALAYAAIVVPNEITEAIGEMFETRSDIQNTLHGALLCAKHLIKRLSYLTRSTLGNHNKVCNPFSTMLANMNQLRNILELAKHFYHNNQCPVTKAAYVDVLIDAMRYEQDLAAFHNSTVKSPALATRFSLDLRRELYASLEYENFGAAKPALRSSLARAFGYQLAVTDDILEDGDLTTSTILSLADRDSDDCCLLFDTYRESFAFEHYGPISFSLRLLQACLKILNGKFDIKLKCTIQRFLLDVADQYPSLHKDVKFTNEFIEACKSASSPVFKDANQHYADLWLQLQGVSLDLQLRAALGDVNCFKSSLMHWIKSCCAAVRGHGLYSHEAAAFAISRVSYIWSYIIIIAPSEFRDLCLALYDLLNDDDEDIRILASRAVARATATSAQSSATVAFQPKAAAQSLLEFMVTNWHESFSFFAQAVARAFDVSESHSWNVANELDRLTAVDTALFAEEKQNLYIDDAEQVRVWTQVLSRLNPESIPKCLIQKLSDLASNGLDTLIDRAAKHGALGWTTKAEAFIVGLRVIYGAEYLLTLVDRGDRLSVRPSMIRRKLGLLGLTAAKGGVNDLWIREIERIVNPNVYRIMAFAAYKLHDASQRIFGDVE